MCLFFNALVGVVFLHLTISCGRKKVENQIYRCRLGVYILKIESTAVD